MRRTTHLDNKLGLSPCHQLVHLVDDQIWHVVVGSQLNLELDRGGIVLGLAQVVLATAASLTAFDHKVLMTWEDVLNLRGLRFQLSKALWKFGDLCKVELFCDEVHRQVCQAVKVDRLCRSKVNWPSNLFSARAKTQRWESRSLASDHIGQAVFVTKLQVAELATKKSPALLLHLFPLSNRSVMLL